MSFTILKRSHFIHWSFLFDQESSERVVRDPIDHGGRATICIAARQPTLNVCQWPTDLVHPEPSWPVVRRNHLNGSDLEQIRSRPDLNQVLQFELKFLCNIVIAYIYALIRKNSF